jgi:hypothetical protein
MHFFAYSMTKIAKINDVLLIDKWCGERLVPRKQNNSLENKEIERQVMIRDVIVEKTKIGMGFAHLFENELLIFKENSGIETNGIQTGEGKVS